MIHKKDQTVTNNGFAHMFIPLIIIVVISLIGTYLVVASHALPIDSHNQASTASAPSVNPYTSQCPGNTVKYGVPNKATATIASRQKVFGSPYPSANVTTVNFMGKNVLVNKKIAGCLKAVQWDLIYKYKTHYKLKYIYGASQVDSNNPTNFFHPYGAAVDINPPDNPFYKDCKTSCPHNIPSTWVQAFRAHGFFWGGNYVNSKDYQHFEWHGQI